MLSGNSGFVIALTPIVCWLGVVFLNSSWTLQRKALLYESWSPGSSPASGIEWVANWFIEWMSQEAFREYLLGVRHHSRYWSYGRQRTWRRKWQPIPVFCLDNPMDTGAWRATVPGVTKSHWARMQRVKAAVLKEISRSVTAAPGNFFTCCFLGLMPKCLNQKCRAWRRL